MKRLLRRFGSRYAGSRGIAAGLVVIFVALILFALVLLITTSNSFPR